LARSISSVGYWSGLAAFTSTVAYDVVQILQVAGMIRFPADEILIYGTSLCIFVPFILEMLALHHLTTPDKRFWTHASLMFTTICAVFVSSNYVVQLATVITGRVLDDLGEPLGLRTVVAERLVHVEGRVDFKQQATVETDDTGAYRLFGLPPGEFVVAIAGGRVMLGGGTSTPMPEDIRRTLHNYFPHASSRDQAQVIRVRAGDEIEGINFTTDIPSAFAGVFTPPPAIGLRTAGIIRGRVSHTDGLPARRARVMVSSAERLFTPYATISDNDGRYEFADLRPGRYRITATDMGFRTVEFGQRLPTGRGGLITVAAGAVVDRVDLSIPRGSAIAGRIVDEYGDPVQNANIRVERVGWSGGRRRLLSANGIASRQTDDRGRFRISGLLPGRYVVGAVVGEAVPGWETADMPGYLRTYFPGTAAAAGAQLVEITGGADALDADFALVHGRAATISGRVLTAAGELFEGAVALIQSARSGAIATPVVRQRTRTGGTFEFARLPAGEYVIQTATSREGRSVEGEFGMLFVAVDGADATGLVIRMSVGSSITGRITFEGAAPPEETDAFDLSAEPAEIDLASLADNPTARAEVLDDWTWRMGGLHGPRRLRVAGTPPGWTLARIIASGVDVTDAVLPFGTRDQSLGDLEVVLTDRITEIAGAVVDDRGHPSLDATVVAFVDDSASWYAHTRFVKIADPGTDGTFAVRGLPAGSYLVAAINGTDVANIGEELDNPGFLESLVAGATRVTLSEGQRVSLALRLLAR
jgi:hypothetical protein